jgi:hypothetical protein
VAVAKDASGVTYAASESVGRLPMIGLDSGAIPGTRPDRSHLFR